MNLARKKKSCIVKGSSEATVGCEAPTCEQEERPPRHGDAALGGRVVIADLGALHAHHADDDADKPQQHRHHHEGATRLDVDWKQEKMAVGGGGWSGGRGGRPDRRVREGTLQAPMATTQIQNKILNIEVCCCLDAVFPSFVSWY